MTFCFNWALLDSTTTDAIRRLVEQQLRTALEDRDILERLPPQRHQQNVTNSRRKPCPLQALSIADLRWGHVPPFIELLAMTDGHDFSAAGRQRSEAGTPPSWGAPTIVTGDARCPTPPLATSGSIIGNGTTHNNASIPALSRDPSEQHLSCHVSERSSASTSQLDGSPSCGGQSSGAFPAAPASIASHQQHFVVRPLREVRPHPITTPPTSSVHSSADDIALKSLNGQPPSMQSQSLPPADAHHAAPSSMLAKIVGPNGLYLKFHLTYGGSMSIRLTTTLRTDVVVGVGGASNSGSHDDLLVRPHGTSSPRLLSPPDPFGAPTTLPGGTSAVPPPTAGIGHAIPTGGVGAANSGQQHTVAAAVAAGPATATQQAVPVTLPMEVTAGNLGIDCFVHVNIFNNEMAVWLESSVLSQSPVTKLSIQVIMGVNSNSTTKSGVSQPSLSSSSAPPPFVDERLISSMILTELRGILARSIVAPYFVSVAL